jgi:type III restriction enzyme
MAKPNQKGAWMPNMIDQVADNEVKYKGWRAAGDFDGLSLLGRQFLQRITSADFPKPLYPHQCEAIIRTVFAYEILGYKDVLLNVVTGGGKTLIIAALAAYMRIVHDVQSVLLIAPNTIVRDRLRKDFDPDPKNPHFVYRNFPFYFNSHTHLADTIQTVVLSAGGKMSPRSSPEQVRSANIIIANIQQLYEGSPNLPVLETGVGRLVVFNDEAHNSVAPEWSAVLARLAKSERRVLRIDTTATPERLDGNNPGSSKIYDYRVRHALHDRTIKQIVVCQPDIDYVEYEVYEVDTETGQKRVLKVEEVPWEELEKRRQSGEFSARQYITSEKTIRPLAALAYDALRLQRASAEGHGWKPILFVVAISIEDAKSIQKILKDKEFAEKYNDGKPYKVHLVTEQSEDEDREIVMRLGDDPAHPEVDVVVSVAMLREGWDVKNVGVILLLRRFTCRWVDGRPMSTFGPQTIGRGLRRIRPPALSKEWERCLVVDHPVLEHQWLWDELGADVIRKKYEPGDHITPEDLPEPPPPTQELVIEPLSDADKAAGIVSDWNAPEPVPIEPMREWQAFLKDKLYDKKGVKVKEHHRGIKQRTLDPKRGGMTSLSEQDVPDIGLGVPDVRTERTISDPAALQGLIYDEMASIAKTASLDFGGGSQAYKAFHGIVEVHTKQHFFKGAPIEDEKRPEYLDVVLRHYLPQVRETFEDPSLLHGIWQDLGAH